MTIGIGILASNGIVLATDSEISAGDFKGTDVKMVGAIHEVNGMPPFVAGVAGAGSLNYFQSVRLKVATLVSQSLNTDAKSDSRIEKRLEKFLIDFSVKHVAPYAQFENPPTLEVLIGTWSGDRGGLWASYLGAVRKHVFGYEAIGCGATYAMALLHGHHMEPVPQLTLDSAALLACYVVMQTRFAVRDVGQDTHLLLLSSGRQDNMSQRFVRECEGTFKEHLVGYHRDAFRFMTGMNPELPAANALAARGRLDALRQAINATISPMPQT